MNPKRRLSAFKTTTGALGAMLGVACGGPSDQAPAATEDPILPSNAAKPETDPFFVAHPRTGDFISRQGERIPTPLYYHDTDLFIVYGTADLDVVETTMKRFGPDAASKYQPVIIQDGTKRKAVVRFLLGHHEDCDVGASNELVFNIATTSKKSPQVVIPYVNPASLFVSALQGDTSFMYKLYLTSPSAVTFGIEMFGMDKQLSPVDYQRHQGSSPTDVFYSFDSHDDAGNRVIMGTFHEDLTPAAGLQAASDLATALGLPGPNNLPPPPPVLDVPFVTGDINAVPRGSSTKYQSLLIVNSAGNRFQTIDPNKDKFTFGLENEAGRFLTASGFKALFYTHDPHMKAVLKVTDGSGQLPNCPGATLASCNPDPR